MVPPTNSNNAATTFRVFYKDWLISQEHYQQELLLLLGRNNEKEEEYYEIQAKSLINQVLSHYDDYYEVKSRVIHDDVFLALSPPRLSSIECNHLSLGDFSTGMVFRLLKNNVLDLTEHQSEKINALTVEIKEEEKQLTDELTKLQGQLVCPEIIECARNMEIGRMNAEMVEQMESAIEGPKRSMEDLVLSGDNLRRETVLKVIKTLKPYQVVRFLSAMVQLQLNLHHLGMQREASHDSGGA